MAKRRQRITPKLPKRPRKDTNLSSHSSSASSDSGGVNRAESSSSSKADKKVNCLVCFEEKHNFNFANLAKRVYAYTFSDLLYQSASKHSGSSTKRASAKTRKGIKFVL